MPAYCSIADINLLDAWNLIDSTSFLDSEAASIGVSASALDSPSFTPGAITITAIAIKISIRSSSSGTFTAVLRTGGADVAGTSVTIDNTSIPASGGWVVFKLASDVTLLAATAYTLRLFGSVTSSASVYRDSTANNWSRFLVTTTTATPTTNDQLIVAGNWTGTSGAGNDVTVTIDQTGTPVQFGTTALLQSISIASRGKLKLANSASTAYTMKHRGICQVRGGTLELGTSAARLDATSSFVWTADSVATADSGWQFYSGVVDIYGASDRAKWTTLEADVTAGSSKQLTVASTTGFLVGDTVYLTTTNSTTRTQVDHTTVSSIDSATLMTVASLTYAHTGSNDSNGDRRCRVVNCSRNLTLTGNSVSLGGYIDSNTACVTNMSYVAMWYMGSTASTTGKRGFDIRHGASGSTNLQYCVSYITGTSQGMSYNLTPSAGGAGITITIQHCTSVQPGAYGLACNTAGATDVVVEYSLFAGSVAGYSMYVNGANHIVRYCEGIGNQASGNAANMFLAGDNTNFLPVTGDCSGNYLAFGNYAVDIQTGASSRAYTVDDLVIVDCVSGIYLGVAAYYPFKERQVFRGWSIIGGGSIQPPLVSLGSFGYDFIDCTFTKGAGTWTRLINMDARSAGVLRFIDCVVDNASLTGTLIDQSFVWDGRVKFINCTGMPSTPAPTSWLPYLSEDAVISSQKHNGSNDDHRAAIKQGFVATDTTIKDTGMTRSARLTPNSATVKTGSAMFWRVRVTGSSTITANVKWRKSVAGDGAAYNGNQPRLVMKRNDAVGIAADVVLATGTNAANGAWETIGGTSASFTDEGEVLLCVDCDGTAGWLNIQEISVGSESNDMTYWNDGLPVQYLSGSSGSSGSAFSYASS
jgi:hypothetical protein